MKALKAASIFLVLSLLTIACTSTKLVRKPPPFRIVRMTLAKGVDDRGTRGIPVNPTTTFTTQDPQVVSFVEYENLSGGHELRWEWYSPDGKLYSKTRNYPIKSSTDKYIREGSASHKISVKGTKAQKLPGEWKVRIYLDDVVAEAKYFKINEIRVAKKPPEAISRDMDFGDYHALVIGNKKEVKKAEEARIEKLKELEIAKKKEAEEKVWEDRGGIRLEAEPVYFDFDKSFIRPEYRPTLTEKAEFLKDNPNVHIRIEGNCDERGTNEYNLALGERRAESAKGFLASLGISPDRIETISYGEERPLAVGQNEDSWSQNRRDDFVIMKK